MTTLSLKTASDEAINAAVAEHCAGYVWLNDMRLNVLVPPNARSGLFSSWNEGALVRLKKDTGSVPDYLHDANAVIELLEKANFAVEINFDPTCDTWHVLLMGRFNSEYSVRSGPQETFCKAAAIALLKASGKI